MTENQVNGLNAVATNLINRTLSTFTYINNSAINNDAQSALQGIYNGCVKKEFADSQMSLREFYNAIRSLQDNITSAFTDKAERAKANYGSNHEAKVTEEYHEYMSHLELLASKFKKFA